MRIPKRKIGKQNQSTFDLYITKEKYLKLKTNLEKLKKLRPKYIKEVKNFALMGDFSENAEYQIAKQKLRSLNNRIEKLNNILKLAIIIKKNKDNKKIALGSAVKLQTKDKIITYRILGSAETNPKQGIISHNSPLGSALINKKINDIVLVNNKKYKIIKIIN